MNKKDAPDGYEAAQADQKRKNRNPAGCDPRCAFIGEPRLVSGCLRGATCSAGFRKDKTDCYFTKTTTAPVNPVLAEHAEYAKRLKTLLVVLGGLQDLKLDSLVEQLFDVIFAFQTGIGKKPEYKNNTGLASFDDVFQAAGMPDNGLRWTRADPGGPVAVYLVRFADSERKTWNV